MADIFINYRREDTAGHVGVIYRYLVDYYGHARVFLDTGTIELGAKWPEEIEKHIASCKIFLAVIGKRWLTDRLNNSQDYVRKEIEVALKRDITVIPILVDNAIAFLPEL